MTVREAESRCDALRNDVIETAFADESVTRPLLYRESALRFGTLVDTMEDVVDQLVLVSSNEPWLETDLDHEKA